MDSRPIVRDFRQAGAGGNMPMLPQQDDLKKAQAFDSISAPGQVTVTGRLAVQKAKQNSSLRNSIALDKDVATSGIKTAEDKTFYLVNGFWTDSDVDTAKQKSEDVEFGSAKYFELIKSNPELRKYLSVGTKMVILWKGHCYKIVPPANATT